MNTTEKNKIPNKLLSLFKYKCPRCRQGDMFIDKSSYKLKSFMKMYDHCSVCGQQMEIEAGFYYGTGYVSYALAVAFSVSTFVAWWVLIGFSVDDNRVFIWLIINSVLMLLLQPYFMRLSRAIWLSIFVSYDSNWRSVNIIPN
ncbi:MAG: DUF983 domain-containing protein [Ferruginibacter sp.]